MLAVSSIASTPFTKPGGKLDSLVFAGEIVQPAPDELIAETKAV